MNKDALLATIIGFGVGLTITGLFILGPRVASSMPALPKLAVSFPSFMRKPATVRPSATPAPVAPVTFAVTSPLPEAIVDKTELLVSGTAKPKTIIVMTGVSGDEMTETTADGKFAGKITVAEGKNDITVSGFSEGSVESTTLTVYYTPEEF